MLAGSIYGQVKLTFGVLVGQDHCPWSEVKGSATGWALWLAMFHILTGQFSGFTVRWGHKLSSELPLVVWGHSLCSLERWYHWSAIGQSHSLCPAIIPGCWDLRLCSNGCCHWLNSMYRQDMGCASWSRQGLRLCFAISWGIRLCLIWVEL